jgi:hypothetical protein
MSKKVIDFEDVTGDPIVGKVHDSFGWELELTCWGDGDENYPESMVLDRQGAIKLGVRILEVALGITEGGSIV